MISPLLANCYLHLLDRLWQRRNLKGKLQAHLVRYADDFVVLCRRDVQEPLKVVRHVLDRLGLNETKTQIVDATQASFNFLGFAIRMSRGRRTGKPYLHVCPAEKSLMKIKAKLTQLTARELTPIALDKIVRNVNRSLSGWVNYFHCRNSNLVMEKVKTHAEQRLRTHLMKRHKVKDRGIGACLGVKNIGKPCAGKLHARFDEGGQARACFLLYLMTLMMLMMIRFPRPVGVRFRSP